MTEEGEVVDVVLKRVKAKVQGADEMHEAEHMINVLASKAAGEAVAPFLGYAAVEQAVRGGRASALAAAMRATSRPAPRAAESARAGRGTLAERG